MQALSQLSYGPMIPIKYLTKCGIGTAKFNPGKAPHYMAASSASVIFSLAAIPTNV